MLVFENESSLCSADGSDAVAASGQWELLGLELVRAHRVANNHLEGDDLEWLCRGFRAFLVSDGKVPLERCLRLPTSKRALRRAHRDHWLRKAWALTNDRLSPWRRSEQLAQDIRRFGAGKWSRWSGLDAVPAEATALDEVLFEAFRSHERVPSTAMQLHNIAGQRFTE